MQPGMDRRHHRDVDIAPARRLDALRPSAPWSAARRNCSRGRRRRPAGQAERGERRRMRLIGGDDGKDQLARPRPPRARFPRPQRRRCGIIGALAFAHGSLGRIGLDVVGDDARGEVRAASPALEERLRRLAEAEKSDVVDAIRRFRHAPRLSSRVPLAPHLRSNAAGAEVERRRALFIFPIATGAGARCHSVSRARRRWSIRIACVVVGRQPRRKVRPIWRAPIGTLNGARANRPWSSSYCA